MYEGWSSSDDDSLKKKRDKKNKKKKKKEKKEKSVISTLNIHQDSKIIKAKLKKSKTQLKSSILQNVVNVFEP